MTRRRLNHAIARQVRAFAPGREFRMRVARDTVERFAGGRPLRVLDAGCEDGRLALMLARRHPHWTIVGGDINDDALEVARSRAAQARIENVEFVHLDVTRPFATEEYDAIAAVECLAEIPDDNGAVAAFATALKPDGVVTIHVPERDWRPVLPGSPTSWKREARHGYSAGDLRRILEGAGFDRIDIRPTTRASLHAAEELRARTRSSRLRVRAAVYPLLRSGLFLERIGVTGGEARALLAQARKPQRRSL